MNARGPSPRHPQDPYERIEELESHVQELTLLVRQLLREQGREDLGPVSAYEAEDGPDRPQLIEGVREGVGRALGGVEGEPLESRIGGIWLSRIAAVLAMTAIVLGGAMTFRDEALTSFHKIGIGYALAAAAIGYGLWRRSAVHLFPQTMLGAGLATLYFTTYAAFFIESARVFPYVGAAVPVLVGCLVFLALVIHLCRSQTVAGISLFLIYYTVVLSLNGGATTRDVIYALLTCSMVSVLALVFHATHRWLLFTWITLIATQGTYVFFFLAKPPQVDLSDRMYFWASNGFLTLSYVLFSMICITDAAKTGEFRKTVAPMAGVNSFVYFVLTWFAIRVNYPEYEWLFRLGFAAVLGTFALYANLAGPRRNYLFQIFIAKAVIVFTLALQAYLSHEWWLVAMAVECLGLAFSYKRSGAVVFKVLGLLLLAVTFGGCLVSVRMPGEVALGAYVIPGSWFACVGAAWVFVLAAWFYEHFVDRVAPADRTVHSQWFLADTMFDASPATMSLLHAAAAALVVLFITILDYGDRPELPYLLAGESVLLAVAGFMLRTPQVEVSSVLLLIAAHVSYHLFLFVNLAGFETQPNYAVYTVVVAAYTFFGGYLWERYLRRIRHGRAWEHHVLACVPHLAAVLMLATLIERNLPPIYAPIGHVGLGVAIMAVAAVTLLTALRTASLVAIGSGTASFYAGMYTAGASTADHPDFLAVLLLLLAGYVAAERLASLMAGETSASTSSAVRSALVALAAALGLAGFLMWAPPERLTLYWLGHAVAGMALGVVFRESRYRWAALVVYFVAIGRAYSYDLTELAPLYQFLSFAALCVPLLVISWGYSYYRLRTLRRLRARRGDGPETDE